MSDINKLVESPEAVNNKFEYDAAMQKIREEVAKKLNDYRNTINYMAADAPIATLCLPTATEKALVAVGLLRIYDLFDRDFTKVEGLNVARIRDLTSRIDQFFSML